METKTETYEEISLKMTKYNIKTQIKNTIFKNIENLYEFMNLYDEIYISGSFALSIFNKCIKSNDIDFYIRIKDKTEINKIFNIITFLNKKYNYPILEYTNKTKNTTNNYDFTKNEMFVYNISFNNRTNIDIIFILEPIEDVLKYYDFQMLRNYISPNKTQPNKFIYKSLYYKDIINKELKINPLYVEYIDLMINNNNYYHFKNKIIYTRLLKYVRRGYSVLYCINQDSLLKIKNELLNCCVCLDDKTNILDHYKCNDKHHICLDCFRKLNDKKCPLCRDLYTISNSYYSNIIKEFNLKLY